MPEQDFAWPASLHAQDAVDRLAQMLALTRQPYHGITGIKYWTDHTPMQRNYYLEMAERLLIMMGKPPERGLDMPLSTCATALARKLEIVSRK